MWGWGFETGSHALRLIVGGHFDRFPRSKLMLGHLGETLPFLLWRSTAAPSFTASNSKSAVANTSAERHRDDLGHVLGRAAQLHARRARQDRVMFAADHPFELAQEAGEFLDHVPLAEPLRADIAFNNAAKYFGLTPHPEVRARRASKDDGPGASACILRGPRFGRPPQDEE